MTTNNPVGASTGFRQSLMAALTTLQVPSLHDSAWIGPFEQLAGAGYSLLASEKLGYSGRSHFGLYHPLVQSKIVSLLTDKLTNQTSSENEALDNWLSRFYFNSGIQRVDFAAERLFATFASVPCVCGNRASEVTVAGRWPRFKERLDGAKKRLTHVEVEYAKPLTSLREVIKQLDDWYEPAQPFDPTRGLAMLRFAVNSRKHSVYKRGEALDSLAQPASGTVTWLNAGNSARMETAANAFVLACKTYAELLAWHPNAKG
jgi:hypothetical protein